MTFCSTSTEADFGLPLDQQNPARDVRLDLSFRQGILLQLHRDCRPAGADHGCMHQEIPLVHFGNEPPSPSRYRDPFGIQGCHDARGSVAFALW